MPNMIAEIAVKQRSGNNIPPDNSITDCVNFKPNPEIRGYTMYNDIHLYT